MRVLDENGNAVESPDLEKGRLSQETILVASHAAIAEVMEEGHYETLKEYPNGGKDLKWVVDVPYAAPRDAWDEYEDVLRYVLYTAEELAEIAAVKAAAEEARRKAEEEARRKAEAEAAAAAAKEAERDAWLEAAPERVDALETGNLDQDGAIAAMYEQMATAQLETDEAITGLYEAIAANTTI